MKSFNFLYVALVSFLFLGVISVLDNGRAEAGLGLFNSTEEILLHQWIITEAVDKELEKDLSREYDGLSWQFLQDGVFVVFKDQVIDETGKWQLKNNILLIKHDTAEVKQQFVIQQLDRTEMHLKAGDVQLRLLKLDD